MRSVEEPVFWEIFHRSCKQRRELAAKLGVSAPTISRAVESLHAWGLVTEDDLPAKSRGRHPRMLRINPRVAHLLGIEIDREHITVVVTDMGGGLLGRAALRCSPALSPVRCAIETIHKLTAEALEDAGAGLASISRIGVGHTGALDLEHGICQSWGDAVHWKGVPLRRILGDSFELGVTIDDRARAMAMAERFQSPRDARHSDAIYVIAGTGIGCGLFVAGRLVRGANQAAGELGHMVVDPNGPVCSCGARGCVEALASAPAIVRRAEAAIGAGQSTLLVESLSAQRPLSIEDIVHAANRHDQLAAEVLEAAGAALGSAIADAVNLLNPSLVVLCGKLAHSAKDWLIRPIRLAVRRRCFDVVSRGLEVRLAPFRKDVVAVGCALLAAQDLAVQELEKRLNATREPGRRPHSLPTPATTA